jgi:TetR/AcrR family transcriptional regulator, regulator of cefoperazone and chloramphenicol sensitivity
MIAIADRHDQSFRSKPGGFDNFFTKGGSQTLDILGKTGQRRPASRRNSMLNGLNSTGVASKAHLPPLAPPNRKHDRAGKQKAMMRAALHLFATKGYEATTTREIAAAAGCAEGLIHRYFKGKAGLLSALVEYHISDELTGMNQRPRTAAGLEEEFLQLVDWEIEYLWRNRNFLRVFIPRALVDPSLGGVISRAVISSRAKAVMERLRRHARSTMIPPQELEVLAQSVGVFGLVFGFMRPVLLGQDRARSRKTAATLAAIIVRGLQHPQS